jgi:glycosyltransferase involved in cell wall biosynthesis
LKLLIVTQYFPPEVGAPQNRLYELSLRLIKEGIEVHVLTAMPNYPVGEIFDAYKNKKYMFENMNGLHVHRSSIYATNSKSISKRLRNYFSFVRSSYFVGKKHFHGDFDFVLCESPPLFLGISAYKLAKRLNAKFIFNVSDLWPESAEKLGLVTNKVFLNMAYRLEKSLYRKAALVTGQTQGIVQSINERYPEVQTYWLPNGVDLDYFDPDRIQPGSLRADLGFSKEDILILYAGILGHAQGLEIILKAAEALKNQKNVKFLIVGSGPLKNELITMKNTLALDNVFFIDIVPKSEMPSLIQAVDVALVPLKKLDLFKGAIPSKIFENCAMKKMLLLGVEGEAKELFIDQGKAGLFFKPEDVASLVQAIDRIVDSPQMIEAFGESGRAFVNQFFNRNEIAAKFLVELKKLKS